MNHSRLKAYILLIIVTIIWALAEPIIKFTLGGFSPLIFLTYRFGLASIVSVACFLIFGFRIPKDTKTRWEILLYGLVTSTFSLGLLFFGLQNTTVLNTLLITLINPLLVSIAGVKFLQEHVTLKEKIGMGIAFIGTVLTVVEPLLENGSSLTRLSGNIMVVLYLIFAAIGVILGKKLLRKDVDPLTLTNTAFIVGFVTLLPFALPQIISSNFRVITSPSIPYHLGVFYMAFLSGTLAYLLSNKAQKTIEVGEAAVFSYLYPIFATPLAVLWLGEKITPFFIIGGVIIAVGVAVAEIKKRRVASEAQA
jgi:drug/metabolite transporter (DMT)-like permease